MVHPTTKRKEFHQFQRSYAELLEEVQDLRRENSKMLRHIRNIEGEKREVRDALTAAQAERDALKARLAKVTDWYEAERAGGGL